MEKYQPLLKLFLVLFICTLFIFSVSYFGPQLIGTNKTVATKSQEGITKTAKKSNTVTVTSQPEQETVLNEAVVKLDKIPDDLQTFLTGNSKMEIPAQASFSLLDLVKKQKLNEVNTDTLSMVATGIYQAILPTNFTIEERNISSELPVYAKLGYEAKVNSSENEDLVFSNPNKTVYYIELHQAGSSLVVDLKGEKLPNVYKISPQDEQLLEPKTITQYSPLLYSGQTMEIAAGKEGQAVSIYRETYKGNILVNSELIANDYYPPEERVVVQPLATPAQPSAATTTAATSQPSGTDTEQANQATQTTNSAQSTASSDPTAQNSTSSNLWGSPNEPSK